MATYGRAEGLPRDSLPQHPVKVPVAAGALMMVHREDFLAHGGFYEPLFMYCEELDYCMSAKARCVHGNTAAGLAVARENELAVGSVPSK